MQMGPPRPSVQRRMEKPIRCLGVEDISRLPSLHATSREASAKHIFWGQPCTMACLCAVGEAAQGEVQRPVPAPPTAASSPSSSPNLLGSGVLLCAWSDQKISFLRSSLDLLLTLGSSHLHTQGESPPDLPGDRSQAGFVPSSWPTVHLLTFPHTASQELLGTRGIETHFCMKQSICHKIPLHL